MGITAIETTRLRERINVKKGRNRRRIRKNGCWRQYYNSCDDDDVGVNVEILKRKE